MLLGTREMSGEGLASAQRFLAAAAIMLGILMGALDSSIVNIALPDIAGALKTDRASVVWVANSYQLASAVSMLIFAGLARELGQRNVFGAGVIVFTMSSLGCAMAGSIGILVTMRALQGIGYAAMVTVGLGLYRVIFPPRSLSVVLGWNALAVSFGTTIGPVGGGLIISHFSWPWLFLINLPLGVVTIFYTYRFLPLDAGRATGFDFIGALLSAMALSGLVVGVDQLGRWRIAHLALIFVLTVLVAALWIDWQKRAETPLVPLEIFRSRRFSMAIFSSLCMFTAQGLAMVALPFVLQHDYGYGVLQSAFLFMPWPLAVLVVAPIAGKLATRISGTLLSSVGVMVMSVGLGAIAFLPARISVGTLLWPIGLCGIGYGLFLPPNNSEILSNVPKTLSSVGSGVLSTAKTIGQSLGTALVAATFAMVSEAGGQDVTFARVSFMIAGAVAVVSSMVSVARIHR
ncbi:DHA2 family efflux MFS transporter permease subunit [Pararobbsia silviterrae]|uniref:DHA2 family efflux MFS transporter permease subunit n=1 Tax=Pararobbsia silviterrae TaxID=1792498 RepID=A0A494X8X0_9BURK|nr:DHA2 family efflux MFS transporter permease subunit [Pararobbsia silviterrae]RKP47165.1 DHA2 family efflux MFS transporter permease subunit [Pararobbsia silviterrae]